MIINNKDFIRNNFLKIVAETNGFAEVFAFFNDASYDIRVVGGCVRDLILKREVADFDLATNATPKQVIQVLNKHNLKYFTPGIAHGTVIFIFKNIQYEITTLRRDLKCDGRHASVEYTNNFAEDASRRDLTINAMSIDIEGNLFDYFSGLNDLEKGIIRFVGDPFKRIPEDYLRILRFYRFYSYYGQIIDENSRIACKQNCENIKTLSIERVWQEFSKILIAPQVLQTLEMMANDNILQLIIPDITQEFTLLNKVIKVCNENNIKQTIMRNYFCLTYGSNITHKLILPKKDKFYLAHFNKIFSKSFNIEANINKYIYLYGKELLLEQLILEAALEGKKLNISLGAIIQDLEIPVFPLQSKDIVAKFGLQGEALGQKMKALIATWLDSNCHAKYEELLKEADE
jgi:poly(A) polymerase